MSRDLMQERRNGGTGKIRSRAWFSFCRRSRRYGYCRYLYRRCIMKRSLTLILLLAFFLTLCLSACGKASSEDPGEDKGLQKEAKSLFDYDGEELNLYQNCTPSSPFGYTKDSVVADTALARLESVGQELNCTIRLICPEPEMVEYISARTAAATYYADICFAGNSTKLRTPAQGGAFVAIDDVESILDYHDHEKWGTVEVMETMMCKGILYGLSPQFWINCTTIPNYTFVYNRDLVTGEYGMADPHEHYENKNWTRDVLEEYIFNCTSSANGETSVYGLSTSTKILVRQAILSNGCQMIAVDEEGNLSCGWSGTDAIEALLWAQQLITEHADAVCYKYGSTDFDSYLLFNGNRSSFLLTVPVLLTNSIAFEVNNFGLMPWPSAADVPYGEWIGFYESAAAVSIPNEAIDIEGSAIAIDRIFAPMEGYETFEDIKSYYVTNVLHDVLDAEILFVNRNNPKTQFSYWPDGGDKFLDQILSVAENPKASASEAIERNKVLLEQVIESDIRPNYLALDHYR